MQKALIIIGLVCLAAGLLWSPIAKIGLGRLPGDIVIEVSAPASIFRS